MLALVVGCVALLFFAFSFSFFFLRFCSVRFSPNVKCHFSGVVVVVFHISLLLLFFCFFFVVAAYFVVLVPVFKSLFEFLSEHIYVNERCAAYTKKEPVAFFCCIFPFCINIVT